MPPFFDDISPYSYEVLQMVISKWKLICEAAIPEELDAEMEQVLSLGFQEIEKMENILDFLVGYKVCFQQLFGGRCPVWRMAQRWHSCSSPRSPGFNP